MEQGTTSNAPLCHLIPPEIRSAVLDPPSALTALEAADCRGMPGEFLLRPDDPFSEDSDALLFDAHVAPAFQVPRTRASYYAHWKTFVTYAFVHGSLRQVLPSSRSLLKGYLWSLLRSGLKSGSITLHIYAIIDRHAHHQQTFPATRREINGWIKAFQRICGAPKADHLAITAAHLKCVLRAPRPSLTALRDTAIFALGTVCAMQTSEIAQLDVCDLLFDFDSVGTAAVCIKRRKNDGARGGLWPRIGTARDPQLDIQMLLREWLRRSGLHIHPGCEKQQFPRSSCRSCGRLFSRLYPTGTSVFPAHHRLHGCSKNTITDAVRRCLHGIGVDPTQFSGISMRRGGLTTALSAGVPSDLYALQSGHVSDAWKSYIKGGQLDKLLLFHSAFEL